MHLLTDPVIFRIILAETHCIRESLESTQRMLDDSFAIPTIIYRRQKPRVRIREARH